jgi:hypothetical protein
MGEADEERLELRLLTDASFIEEFDTIVDEIIDQYVEGGFEGEEKKLVEEYFLRAPERLNKLNFAFELLHHASLERSDPTRNIQPIIRPEPGIFERARLFWRSQSFSLRLASTIATVAIIGVVLSQIIPFRSPTPGTYASITLTISNSERAVGAETKSVRMEPGNAGIRIELTLPNSIPEAKSYRVEMLNPEGSPRALPITEQHAQSLIVEVPEPAPGSYIIHLYAVNEDGTEKRIYGSYFFAVE